MHAKFKEAIELHKDGKLIEANNILLEILKETPNDFNSLHLLGIIAFQTNRYGDSVKLIKKASEVNPNNSEVYKNLAIAYKSIGQFEDALKSCNNAIELNSNFAEAYNHKALILIELNQYDSAIKNWNRAVEIKPNFAEVFNNLGNVHAKLKKYDESIDYYNKAIQIKINFSEAYINRAFILKEFKKYDLALEDCNKAISINPNFAEAYNNKGIILKEQKKIDLAYKNYIKAYKIKPELDFLLGALVYSQLNLCIWDSFDKDLRDLEKKILKKKRAVTPFSTLLFFDSPNLQKIATETFLKTKYTMNAEIIGNDIKKKHKTNKKIRIGYYSADFCVHPVSNLIIKLIELHDKSKFDLYGFYFGPDKKDEMFNRSKKAFDHFYDVNSKSDKEIAKLSRDLNIDIAVDLMVFTEKNRFGIFVEKCAPIQVNYLGYPGTSASKHIDYIIADKTLIPKKNQNDYSEKIIYLPDTYQANDPTKKISDKIFTKKKLGLPEDAFVFCCFNKNQKITPNVFDSWIRILKKVDNSVLWLLDENEIFSNSLKNEAEKRNINSKRIIFAKRLILHEHLARHKVADLFIDTFPYGAHTTCSDALWAGLPVLTRIGQSFASRVSASLLNAIDLPELITNTESEYVNMAIELATDSNKLMKIKDKLKKNRLSKALFDVNLFTKNIEAAYKIIYEKYLTKMPPENIDI